MSMIREEIIAHVEPVGPRGHVVGFRVIFYERQNPTPPPEPETPEGHAFPAWRNWTHGPRVPEAIAAPPEPAPVPAAPTPETPPAEEQPAAPRTRPRPRPRSPG